MSKSVEKCKKTNEGNTFHEKYTDPDDSHRFLKKFEMENESSNRLENTSK